VIVLPQNTPKEKVDIFKALGAQIVTAPTATQQDAIDPCITVAKRLQTEIANSHILDENVNLSNPNAHHYGTAEELWKQCDQKIDLLVAQVDTGGTIGGIARKLKQYNPNIIIVGVDPVGSQLEPDILDRFCIDKCYVSDETESLSMMGKLMREEGLLCGGSCGAVMSIAVKAAKEYKLTGSHRCVVIFPDSVRNFILDDSVIKPKVLKTWWADKYVRDIPLATPFTIKYNVTCEAAIAILKSNSLDMVTVIGETGSVVGVVTVANISSQILSGRINSANVTIEDANVIDKTFRKVGMHDKVADLAHILDHETFAFVTEQSHITSIVKRIDLLHYISQGEYGQSGNVENTELPCTAHRVRIVEGISGRACKQCLRTKREKKKYSIMGCPSCNETICTLCWETYDNIRHTPQLPAI
jgi:cystathionine beta-synthase